MLPSLHKAVNTSGGLLDDIHQRLSGDSLESASGSASNSSVACTSPHPFIKHVIVLMLENRSFDHMLGYSKIPGVDGLWDKQLGNPWNGERFPAEADASLVLNLVDPGHDYDDVRTQMYFPHQDDTGPRQPTMEGFIQSYGNLVTNNPERIMSCYAPEDLPVLNTLAREFAVCNRWFSSIPGPTLPNRLFAHAGTSKGRLDLSAEEFDITPTIYEILDDYNVASTIYADGWSATATFWALMKHQDQYLGTLDDFYQDCYDNNLPGYCFIEPRYSSGIVNGIFRPQNDQHPDSDVAEGENLISDIYIAIRSNKAVWESSVFVIVYDEHGGLYDHVPPPDAIPPGGCPSSDPPFNFDRYGIRVPAVIISAYTQRVVCNKLYDHTSLIATARKLLTGCWCDDRLGNRAMFANTFDEVFNLQTPRNDTIDFPQPASGSRKSKIQTAQQKAKQKGLNDLQIKHLKQAFLLDSALNLHIQRSSKFKHLVLQDPPQKFKAFTPEEAEHYIQNVLNDARRNKRKRPNPLQTKCADSSKS
jgi:phospholipase C